VPAHDVSGCAGNSHTEYGISPPFQLTPPPHHVKNPVLLLPFIETWMLSPPPLFKYRRYWLAALIVLLAQFFSRTIYGKALRATAVNRNGARLMGISPNLAGRLTLMLSAAIGRGLRHPRQSHHYPSTTIRVSSSGSRGSLPPSSAGSRPIRPPRPERSWWGCSNRSAPSGRAPTRR